MAAKCNETTTTGDERDLKCALTKGHDGPVHEDASGEAWGDPRLPAPADTSPLPPDDGPVTPA